MNLFSKDKELIHKITNAILVLWFIGSLLVVTNSVIDLALKEPQRAYSYEEYKELYCIENEEELNCKMRYDDDKYSSKYNTFSQQKTLYFSLASAIIVGSAAVVLNRDKK